MLKNTRLGFSVWLEGLMTVEEIDEIDRLAFDSKIGDVLLVISDHLDWDENGASIFYCSRTN
jgi:hypothetical protein